MVKKVPNTGKAEETVEKTEETVKADKPEKANAKPAKLKKEDAGFFVYLGPSIRGVVQTASVHMGSRSEVEEELAGQIERYPLIKRLLVSGDTLPEDRINVRTPGNGLYNAYERLCAELKKQKEE